MSGTPLTTSFVKSTSEDRPTVSPSPKNRGRRMGRGRSPAPGLLEARVLRHFENGDCVQQRLGNKRPHLHKLRQLGAVGAALGAVIVVAPGAKSVERRDGVPNQVAVAQAATLFATGRNA